MGYIKINKIKCLHCGDILYSPEDEPNTPQKCSCGKCECLGGSSTMIRKGLEDVDYKEMSEYDLSKYSGKITDEVAEPPPGNDELIKNILNSRKGN